MHKLHFEYEMCIEYSIPVQKCYFTIKCMPKDTKRQLIDNLRIYLYPNTNYSVGKDGFANTQIYGIEAQPHKMFKFRIDGDATTGLCEYEEDVDDNIMMVFKHPYGLNVPGDNLKAYYEKHKPENGFCTIEYAKEMMHTLHRDFIYEPCTTDNKTSAEEAFTQGKGVCQDMAHIFIALMHMAGIPARYVTGIIVGEGASHAWVEVVWKGKWYGLDPTNDKVVSDEHIKIGVGRDANDCQINRGIMYGGGLHIQTVNVNVKEEQ